MILNKPQAEAVYRAMCELNNAKIMLKTDTINENGDLIQIVESRTGIVTNIRRNDGSNGRYQENFPNQNSFAFTYGINPC